MKYSTEEINVIFEKAFEAVKRDNNPQDMSSWFVMAQELASFECLVGYRSGVDLAPALVHFGDERTRVKNGGLLTIHFQLDALKNDVDCLLTAEQRKIRYAVGCAWLPIYNAECFTLIPGKEYAVLFEATMLYCFQYYSYALIKTDGHLYADLELARRRGKLRVAGESRNIARRASAAVDLMVDGTEQLLSKFPPPLQWGIEDSHRGNMAFRLSRLFASFALAHEIGHMQDSSTPATSLPTISIAHVTPRILMPKVQHEYAADSFAFNLLQKKHRDGVLNFVDFFFRVASVYSFLMGQDPVGLDHPPIPNRFATILNEAVRQGLVSLERAENYMLNHDVWTTFALQRIADKHQSRLLQFRKVFAESPNLVA